MRWFVVLNGIADAWLWGFDADEWWLRHGNPAAGTLGILPSVDGGEVATLDDALWLADALAFDHDAPVGVRPAMTGRWPMIEPKDPAAVPPVQPVEPLEGPLGTWYWDALSTAHGAAAELRFNGSYVIRYDSDFPDPGTNFRQRFENRELALSMYAMAARQPDLLSEYLCLYRILEGADGTNGKEYVTAELPNLLDQEYGFLRVARNVVHEDQEAFIDVFELYRTRAKAELDRLRTDGVSDVPAYLYRIRNSLAHGKVDVLAGDHEEGFQAAARALPIVKLLARRAVDPA